MMKKVNIVWILIVIVMLSMAGCTRAPNAAMESTSADGNVKLEFESKGTYTLRVLGEEYSYYLFDEPNASIVVYKTIDGIYLVGEKNGISYGNIFMPDGEFIALSNEYLLFESEEGKIAIGLEKRKNVEVGESFYNMYAFEELSDAEKNAFVYPIEYKEVKN